MPERTFEFLDDMREELAATRRTLERVPEGRGDWRPHAKSRTLAELATHVADIPGLAATILQSEELDAMARPRRDPLTTAPELLERFDGGVAQLHAALQGIEPSRLAKDWVLRAGDQVFVRRPRRQLLRTMFLSHMIHHRAQLGVYLRLLDVPVPSVYGPTADEAFRG